MRTLSREQHDAFWRDGYLMAADAVTPAQLAARFTTDATIIRTALGQSLDAVGVDWGSVVQVIDAATGANAGKVQFLKHTRGRPPAGGQPPNTGG